MTLQDEIARQLATHLEPALLRAEFSSVRRRRSDSLDAWSHYRQAVGASWSMAGAKTDWQGIAQLGLAIAADPPSRSHTRSSPFGRQSAPTCRCWRMPTRHGKGHRTRPSALALDPNDFDVLGFTGCALADLGETSRGRKLLERALEFDPSNAQARVALGVLQARGGEHATGIENMRLGIRSSPQDFRLGFFRCSSPTA